MPRIGSISGPPDGTPQTASVCPKSSSCRSSPSLPAGIEKARAGDGVEKETPEVGEPRLELRLQEVVQDVDRRAEVREEVAHVAVDGRGHESSVAARDRPHDRLIERAVELVDAAVQALEVIGDVLANGARRRATGATRHGGQDNPYRQQRSHPARAPIHGPAFYARRDARYSKYRTCAATHALIHILSDLRIADEARGSLLRSGDRAISCRPAS